jgi:CP family cyanate transporter-like MFS transporter
MMARSGGRLALWAGLGVCLISINLRPGATSVGPVLDEARDALGLNGVAAALLVALPGLCFAIFGALAVLTARLTGVIGALALGTVLMTAGLLTRVLATGGTGFLLLTAVALAGAALGNVLVPAFIKSTVPRHQTLLLTLYTTGLAIGSTAPGLIGRRIIDAGLGDWRTSLGLWGVVAGVAAVGWIFAAGRQRGRIGVTRTRTGVPLLRLFRSRRAIALAIFFGVQSAQAYVAFGFLPQILRDDGLDPSRASDMAALYAFWGLPTGLLLPLLVARVKDVRWLMWTCCGLYALGYLGLLVAASDLPWLWVGCLGLGGAAFPLALALIGGRTRDIRITAALSGFAQSAGYVCAAAGPFLIGLLNAWTGGWTVPLLVLIASIAALAWSGNIIGRPGTVDDEIGSIATPTKAAKAAELVAADEETAPVEDISPSDEDSAP